MMRMMMLMLLFAAILMAYAEPQPFWYHMEVRIGSMMAVGPKVNATPSMLKRCGGARVRRTPGCKTHGQQHAETTYKLEGNPISHHVDDNMNQ